MSQFIWLVCCFSAKHSTLTGVWMDLVCAKPNKQSRHTWWRAFGEIYLSELCLGALILDWMFLKILPKKLATSATSKAGSRTRRMSRTSCKWQKLLNPEKHSRCGMIILVGETLKFVFTTTKKSNCDVLFLFLIDAARTTGILGIYFSCWGHLAWAWSQY